jgi:divalent metal cation (Fe/Co/Zn/Cd) transporter
MNSALQNFKVQKLVAFISIVLFLVKVLAWYLTGSVAILTDALESTVNVIAGLIGLYSLYVSAKPKDMDHPYGHGKAEFISAAIEGTLIAVAGVIIIYEAINNLFKAHSVQKLDWGIILVAITAIINYIAGALCERTGKKNNSSALIASGKHLKSDTYTTIGIVGGLILLYFTRLSWIDSALALLFAFIIIYTGYKIIRSSIIKYGATIHLDCHLTVPWYFNVHEAHREIDGLSELVRKNFGESVELFVHSDGCLDFSCAICSKADCAVRKHPFTERVEWTMENILSDNKHKAGKT